jgi:hypothetical protein
MATATMPDNAAELDLPVGARVFGDERWELSESLISNDFATKQPRDYAKLVDEVLRRDATLIDSALVALAYHGNAATLKRVLKTHNVNSKLRCTFPLSASDYEDTVAKEALAKAIERGHEGAVKVLLEHRWADGVQLKPATDIDCFYLMVAARHEGIRELLRPAYKARRADGVVTGMLRSSSTSLTDAWLPALQWLVANFGPLSPKTRAMLVEGVDEWYKVKGGRSHGDAVKAEVRGMMM